MKGVYETLCGHKGLDMDVWRHASVQVIGASRTVRHSSLRKALWNTHGICPLVTRMLQQLCICCLPHDLQVSWRYPLCQLKACFSIAFILRCSWAPSVNRVYMYCTVTFLRMSLLETHYQYLATSVEPITYIWIDIDQLTCFCFGLPRICLHTNPGPWKSHWLLTHKLAPNL